MPQVRRSLTTTQYTKDKVRLQGAGPAMSQSLEPAQVTAWCKKTDQVNQMEKTIRNLKTTYLEILEQGMSERQARLEVTTLIGLVLRCMFAKPWPENMVPKVALPVGKFSEEKIKAILIQWAKIVDKNHPTLKFADLADLHPAADVDHEGSQEVELEGLKVLKRNDSGGPEPDGPKFKRGDEVTVIRRMSWNIVTKKNPKFKKDINEGQTGSIEGRYQS